MAQTSYAFFYYILSVFIFSIGVEPIASNDNSLKLNNITNSLLKTTAPKSGDNQTTIIASTHNGREGLNASDMEKVQKPISVSEKSQNKTEQKVTLFKNTTTSSNSTVSVSSKPTVAAVNITKITINTQKTAITKETTPKPRKPERTEHDEVELPAAKTDTYNPSPAHIDMSMDKKVRRADYVVPIVAVILSVPLVAIIISVLYKRGKDWWQHRNYRRMDFLIEGMYNS